MASMAFPRANADPDSTWPSAWASHHRQRPERDVVELLGEILDGVPRLEHPSCTRHATLFDDPGDTPCVAVALAICQSCPALGACRNWSLAQPSGSLRGVIGGELYGPT
jgi:hypothetical protein